MSPRVGIPFFSHDDKKNAVEAVLCRHCSKPLRNRKWMIVVFPLEQGVEAGHVGCEEKYQAEVQDRANKAAAAEEAELSS